MCVIAGSKKELKICDVYTIFDHVSRSWHMLGWWAIITWSIIQILTSEKYGKTWILSMFAQWPWHLRYNKFIRYTPQIWLLLNLTIWPLKIRVKFMTRTRAKDIICVKYHQHLSNRKMYIAKTQNLTSLWFWSCSPERVPLQLGFRRFLNTWRT